MADRLVRRSAAILSKGKVEWHAKTDSNGMAVLYCRLKLPFPHGVDSVAGGVIVNADHRHLFWVSLLVCRYAKTVTAMHRANGLMALSMRKRRCIWISMML